MRPPHKTTLVEEELTCDECIEGVIYGASSSSTKGWPHEH